jgi:hypothetical protein
MSCKKARLRPRAIRQFSCVEQSSSVARSCDFEMFTTETCGFERDLTQFSRFSGVFSESKIRVRLEFL